MSGIRDQIIKVCKDIYDSNVASILAYDETARENMPASVPQALIIVEFDSCTRSLNKIKEGYRSTEIIRAWIYKDGVLDSYELKKEPETDGRRDYYKETYARFAFSEEKKVLYLNIFFAHLFARGWMYPLVESEEGLVLGEREVVWVS